MEFIGLKASGTVGIVEEAKAKVAAAERDLAKAEAQATLFALSDADLARRLAAFDNQIAYAKRQIEIARAEQARRKGQ